MKFKDNYYNLSNVINFFLNILELSDVNFQNESMKYQYMKLEN